MTVRQICFVDVEGNLIVRRCTCVSLLFLTSFLTFSPSLLRLHVFHGFTIVLISLSLTGGLLCLLSMASFRDAVWAALTWPCKVWTLGLPRSFYILILINFYGSYKKDDGSMILEKSVDCFYILLTVIYSSIIFSHIVAATSI